MRKLIVVAHPDDEYIFAHNLIKSSRKTQWDVLCATYTPDSARGKEFKSSCDALGAVALYLCGVDDPYSHLTIIQSPTMVLPGYDEIYTHNPVGEYGHPHHTDVSKWVSNGLGPNTTKKLWYFAHNYKKPEKVLSNMKKLTSPCREIYERESYMINNFDLINEGFVRAK